MEDLNDLVLAAAVWNPTTLNRVLITTLRHDCRGRYEEKFWAQLQRMLSHGRIYSSNVPRQVPVQVQEYNAMLVEDRRHRNPSW